MPRIFACLAIANLIVLMGTAVVGLFRPFATSDVHVALAVFSLLVSCMVQVLAFTYLTVSGKVVGQAVHLAGLDRGPIQRVASRKRTNTRLLAVVIVSIVLVTGTGAAHWRARAWSSWHLLSTLVLLTVHVLVFLRQYGVVVENNQELEDIVAAYTKHRQQSKQPGEDVISNT